ncbi:MAG TPA: hypothetical protein VF580_02070 [Thermoanaerobaculia bacterium]
MKAKPSLRPEDAGDRPPFGWSWGVLYAGVLLNLVLLVVLFSLLSKAFR